jgi:phage major head subunit gpT-like protein
VASNYYTPEDAADKTTPWFLLDTSRAIKPLIWQERVLPSVNSLIDGNNEYTFLNDKYAFGVRARGNAGYGFWQLAAMSDMELNSENFNSVYEGMIAIKGSNGATPLRITPKILVVPPSLRQKAYEVIKRERLENGESNINYQAVEIMVCPYL